MHIGQVLRSARRAAGLSVRETARLLGVTKNTIVDWEAGRHEPQGRNLLALHALLEQLTPWTCPPQGDPS